jgi:hypothetical protein
MAERLESGIKGTRTPAELAEVLTQFATTQGNASDVLHDGRRWIEGRVYRAILESGATEREANQRAAEVSRWVSNTVEGLTDARIRLEMIAEVLKDPQIANLRWPSE